MSTHLQDNAQDVQPDSFQVTLLEDSKMVPVIELIKIALVKVKYSWLKINASDAKLAHLGRLIILCLTLAPLQDHNVDVLKNITVLLDNANNAQQVTCQTMVVLFRTTDVLLPLKTVTHLVKYNSIKTIATDAKLAHSVQHGMLLQDHAKQQDHNADVLKNITVLLDNANNAQQVTCQTMVVLFRTTDVLLPLKTVTHLVKYNSIKTIATDAKLAHSVQHGMLLQDHAKQQDHNADVLKNITVLLDNANNANQVTCQTMVELFKITDVLLPHKTAMQEDKYNSIKTIATDAKLVHSVQLGMLLPDHAKHQDHSADVLKNITVLLDNANNAKQVTCQTMAVLFRTTDVLSPLKTVTQEDKYNSIKTIATDAKLVHSVQLGMLLPDHAKHQDHSADVLKNITVLLDNANNAKQVTCQTMAVLFRTTDVLSPLKTVTQEDKYNSIKTIATDAKLVHSVQFGMLLPDHAEHQDHHAVVLKNMTLPATLADNAKMVTFQTTVELLKTTDVLSPYKTAMLEVKFNSLKHSATDAKLVK